MTNRLRCTILAAGFCGLVLLSLRQQRIAIIHEMSRLHSQLEDVRTATWRARADVAALAAPSSLSPDPSREAAVPSGPPHRPMPPNVGADSSAMALP